MFLNDAPKRQSLRNNPFLTAERYRWLWFADSRPRRKRSRGRASTLWMDAMEVYQLQHSKQQAAMGAQSLDRLERQTSLPDQFSVVATLDHEETTRKNKILWRPLLRLEHTMVLISQLAITNHDPKLPKIVRSQIVRHCHLPPLLHNVTKVSLDGDAGTTSTSYCQSE